MNYKGPAIIHHNAQQPDVRSYYRYLYSVIPLLLTAIVFSIALKNSFIGWDDGVYVTGNDLIRSLSLHNLFRMFSPGTLVCGNYQPVTILSLAINYALGRLNPSGYIGANIFLHLLNVYLVFIFIRKISQSDRIAFLCATLFGIHPMHVESVAWVSGRKDLLYSFFYLLALLWYLRYLGKHGNEYIISFCIVLVLSVLSLLSKSAAVTLPAVFFLLDYFSGRRFSAKLIIEKLPFLVIAIIAGVLAIKGQQTSGSLSSYHAVSITNRLLIGGYSYMFYAVKFFAPVQLSAYYPYPDSLPGVLPFHYSLSSLFVIFSAGLVYYFRRSKVIIFGFCFFLFNVIFILHFVPVGKTITADRFSYLSYIGLSYIVAYYFKKILSTRHFTKIPTAAFALFCMCIVTLLCYASYRRCEVWKDDFSLWSDVIDHCPSSIAYNNRGSIFLSKGDPVRAITDFDQAIRLNPSASRPYYNRGIAFADKGEFGRAIKDYYRAIMLNPNYTDAFYNAGRAYQAMNDFDHAIECFNRAVKIDGSFAPAHNCRGVSFCMKGDFDRAIIDYNWVTLHDPLFIDAYINRGNAYLAKGLNGRAIEDYTKAITLDSSCYSQVYYNRGIAFARNGDSARADDDFKKACAMNLAVACDALKKY